MVALFYLSRRGPLLGLGRDRARQRRHVVEAIAASLPLGDQRKQVLQRARSLQRECAARKGTEERRVGE